MPRLNDLPYKLSVLMRPFENFFKSQTAGGVILLCATVVALVLANSPAREAYQRLWEMELTIGFREAALRQSLHHWINDGLMAIFFFVVGLEIKREFLTGELASPRKAALPIAAALGGMIFPAVIYYLFNPSSAESQGWGIPMATDIAFALGVIALLGNRIPRSLAVFLTALAIVDDLGAVLVIALFYTESLSASALGGAAVFLALLVVLNRLGVRHSHLYLLFGFCLWLFVLKSGIHASVAGVLIGATIPARPRLSPEEFMIKAEYYLDQCRAQRGDESEEEESGTLLALGEACRDAVSPLQRFEHDMHHWVIYGIMPIFALANAGVSLSLADLAQSVYHPVTQGVAAGLFLGKPLGIFLFSWLAVRLGICELPAGARWGQVFGIGILGGIGFTMSLFITNLAFSDAHLITDAKVGIFAASLLSGLLGYLYLSRTGKTRA